MENKNVGFMILGISIVIVVIIFLFDAALKKIVIGSCTAEHAPTCPMYTTINEQTYLALAIAGILVIIGFVFIFSKPVQPVEKVVEKVVVKKVKEKEQKIKIDISDLGNEEKQVVKILEEKKVIFQADLIEQTKFNKAKMSRILDKLEGKGVAERKRRGLTNVVVLKEGNMEIVK